MTFWDFVNMHWCPCFVLAAFALAVIDSIFGSISEAVWKRRKDKDDGPDKP